MMELKIQLRSSEEADIYDFLNQAYYFAKDNEKRAISDKIKDVNDYIFKVIQKGYDIDEITLNIRTFVRPLYGKSYDSPHSGEYITQEPLIIFTITAENINYEFVLNFTHFEFIQDGDRQHLKLINEFLDKYRDIFFTTQTKKVKPKPWWDLF